MEDNELNKLSDEYKRNKKKKTITIVSILLVVVLVIGTSYALWQLTFTQSGTNTIATGCLNLTLTDDTDAITLNEASPMTDTEGKELVPYTFTITNTCNTETKYVVNLETVSQGDKILSDEYIKANLLKGSTEVFIDKLLPTHVNEEKVISTATKAYMLDQGTLKDKESLTYSLRLWISDDASDVEEMIDRVFASKITLTASYIPSSNKNNIMKAMNTYTWYETTILDDVTVNETYTQNRKYLWKLKKVVFEDALNPYENAEEVVDFSESQDESILGYYVKIDEKNHLGNDMYILYIQSDGKIKVNQNGSYYFLVGDNSAKATGINYDYNSVEGLENLNTSNVTNIDYMFLASSLQTIDLTSLDTRKVTTMKGMFERAIATTIIFSNFNTSNVTNTSYMFNECSNLTTVDLKSLDTSKVTDMSFMFSECSNLTTTINITNPNVEKYSSMFYEAATKEGTQITVNYTAETESLVDKMIATKSANSNVVKGALIS